MGQYGFLLRTNLEHVNLFQIDGAHAKQRERAGWQVRIDGIEGYRTYLTPVHDYAYNRVLIGNAMDILPTIPDRAYELVLAVDILEHFSAPDGRAFIAHCLRISSRAVLVSTPKLFVHQEVAANPLENHRSVWIESELHSLGLATTLDSDESWVVVRQQC